MVKEKWKDEREGKKYIYIYNKRDRERENVPNYFPDPIEGILVWQLCAISPHLRLQLIRFSQVGACERSNELACS